MRPMHVGLSLALALAVPLWAGPAQGRSDEDLRYRYDLIWNAAVRLVRVEMGLTIEERDPEAGFFLFTWVDHGKAFPGSLELVRRGDGRDSVKCVVNVGGMPTYIERMILSKLQKKLEDEYGTPPDRPPEPEPTPKPKPKPPSDSEPAEDGEGDEFEGA